MDRPGTTSLDPFNSIFPDAWSSTAGAAPPRRGMMQIMTHTTEVHLLPREKEFMQFMLQRLMRRHQLRFEASSLEL